MAFVRGAWKILVGIKDAMVILFLLIFFGALAAIMSASPNPASVVKGALLLDINGVIVEEPKMASPRQLLLSGGDATGQTSARDLIRAIETASEDDRITAIVLDLQGFLGGGQVVMQDVAKALQKAKKAKKPIYSFANFYSDDAYYLAAHGDEIWMDKYGAVYFAGFGGKQIYYKDVMDKMGVKANIYRVGTYKSAVEPYMLNKQSDASKEATRGWLEPLFETWKADVKKARPSAQFEDYIAAPAKIATQDDKDLAQTALSLKLVDKLASYQEFEDFITDKVGENFDDQKDVPFASNDMAVWLADNEEDQDGEEIAVVTVAGQIVDGYSGPGTGSGDRIAKILSDRLAEDELPKALVVRVDSPGGSMFASEKIRMAIMAYKEKKIPVVISMGNVAASGGYWVAAAGDHIMAEPSTITGSIGIFAMLPSFENAANKWGVNADGVGTTPLTGEPDIINGFSDDFNTIMQSTLEDNYGHFINLVAKSRGKTADQIDTIAQGRVWDGGTARQHGLVDSFGSLDDALKKAAELAKIDKDTEYFAHFLVDEDQGFERFLMDALKGNNVYSGQSGTAEKYH